MESVITIDNLIDIGLDKPSAEKLFEQINAYIQKCITAEKTWEELSKNVLAFKYPFDVHLFIFTSLFPNWNTHPELAPAWLPSTDVIATANITKFMAELALTDIKAMHKWSVEHYQEFWERVLTRLNIQFSKKPDRICDLSKGIEAPQWFPEAKLNIADSCFKSQPDTSAILYLDENNNLCKMTYRELNLLSNRIAKSLIAQGFKSKDAIAIAMPMNEYAVAIYLGIIKMGGVVVSIADSFSSEEIAVRLKIAQAKGIFTQDFISWDGKKLPLYEKVKNAQAAKIIVLKVDPKQSLSIRTNDLFWNDFLTEDDQFNSVPCDPMAPSNILFSSGTTGTPKAIPWNHTTPIKAASDAYFHQNIQSHDILAWPTNLGWMMGPWLIYATLINGATMALFNGAPKDKAFGQFIQNAKVTMLGLVPTLVSAWRRTKCMEQLDWSNIKAFSSSGESSNPEDMLYLMSLAGYKPIIEYCGGTEIGGGYISSTVIEENYPALFSTAAMGSNFTILDEHGKHTDDGEVALIPPAIGLSTELLNSDHYQVYFSNMPKSYDGKPLRRHGDQIKQLSNGYYMILGRVDDAMKLGGIKISSAELERTLAGIPGIKEIAAIAVIPPNRGPSQLVIYAATTEQMQKEIILKEMQKKINIHLNPLFKIYDVVFIKELPKTASNKIMRRTLRKDYQEKYATEKNK